MRLLLLIASLVILAYYCSAQKNYIRFSIANFDTEILSYEAINNNISANSFSNGKRFLKETQQRIKKNGKADVADYWNLLTAFNELNESEDNLQVAFKKFISATGSCEYLISFERYFDNFRPFLKDRLVQQFHSCKEKQAASPLTIKDPLSYAKQLHLNEALIRCIHNIETADQTDRYNPAIQEAIDLLNQQKIDSLFKVYNTYLGRSLVGEQYKHVMWMVIQHSNKVTMERYLPIIASAVRQKELHETPLKYLLDRIYTAQYGYQLFGSQRGIPLANEAIIEKVKKQYDL